MAKPFKGTINVDGFWIDDHPVTVAEFRRFAVATGYVTAAERPLDPARYPGADPALLRPGSLVFFPTSGPADLRDVPQWWRYTPGADWRHPAGPASTVGGLERRAGDRNDLSRQLGRKEEWYR